MGTKLATPVAEPRPAPAPAEKRPGTERLMTLDAYRGFTMLLMVSSGLAMGHLLNAQLPPSPANQALLVAADQLRHREWDMTFADHAGFPYWHDGAFHEGTGCTPWDLIQPSFMFIVGAAMPFAFAVRQSRGASWGRQLLHAARRSVLLILVGVFLDTYSERFLSVSMIRVLQQIAVGYFLAFLVLHLRPRWQAAAAVLCLVVHTLAYFVYGWATGNNPCDQIHNVGWAIDGVLHQVFSLGGRYPTIMPHPQHLYVNFNAISSTATILFGVLAGELLRKDWPAARKLLILAVAGVAGIALGLGLSYVVPINKKIWTSSFTLFAGGCTLLLLLAFYAVIDVLRLRRWAFPFVVVGMNSIAIYVMAGTLASVIRRAWQAFLGWPTDGSVQAVPRCLESLHTLFGWPSPAAAALAAPILLAVLVMAGEWLVCLWLYRRRIFFKV
ncbi:MAG TPA: DUF5009 domain-containing protein [Gemmataceae bacterium]|nr:DUF5009 domain-containing protein [Gemmataceae bacterium]